MSSARKAEMASKLTSAFVAVEVAGVADFGLLSDPVIGASGVMLLLAASSSGSGMLVVGLTELGLGPWAPLGAVVSEVLGAGGFAAGWSLAVTASASAESPELEPSPRALAATCAQFLLSASLVGISHFNRVSWHAVHAGFLLGFLAGLLACFSQFCLLHKHQTHLQPFVQSATE